MKIRKRENLPKKRKVKKAPKKRADLVEKKARARRARRHRRIYSRYDELLPRQAAAAAVGIFGSGYTASPAPRLGTTLVRARLKKIATTPEQAIHRTCLACVGGADKSHDVELCTDVTCPLWRFRSFE